MHYFMNTKKTILSEKELKLIEALIADYGYIVSFEQVYKKLNIGRQSVRNLINKLIKNGWFVKVKKGTYAIASLESHSFSNISPLVISRVFVSASYVSFEFALNHWGHFDQFPSKITSITSLKSKKYHFQNLEYVFIKAKSQIMIGYKEITLDGQKAKVAELEKALLDFLNFRKDSYTIDLVLEKLKEASSEIDSNKLIDYSNFYPTTTQRRLGFLLDLSGIESNKLHDRIRNVSGFAKLTNKSDIFNAKWRLYYENRFAK